MAREDWLSRAALALAAAEALWQQQLAEQAQVCCWRRCLGAGGALTAHTHAAVFSPGGAASPAARAATRSA